MDSKKSVLVVSAHAADFVWRAGGAIALYAQRGYRVRILCLSYGERGESERLWRQPGMTLECVKTSRRPRAPKTPATLGSGAPAPPSPFPPPSPPPSPPHPPPPPVSPPP